MHEEAQSNTNRREGGGIEFDSAFHVPFLGQFSEPPGGAGGAFPFSAIPASIRELRASLVWAGTRSKVVVIATCVTGEF